MLRQDPVECLFQFICSSNNHISRIHGMVEKLCRSYGTPLKLSHAGSPAADAKSPNATGGHAGNTPVVGTPSSGMKSPASAAAGAGAAPRVKQEAAVKDERAAGPSSPATPSVSKSASAAAGSGSGALDGDCFAFPSLQQLSKATEQQLRDAGFGYRAKYVTGSVQALLAKPGGGAEWLLSLRSVPFEEVRCSFAGASSKLRLWKPSQALSCIPTSVAPHRACQAYASATSATCVSTSAGVKVALTPSTP